MAQAQVARLSDGGCCPRCDFLGELVRVYADALALRDWEIQVMHGEPYDAGAIAEAEGAAGRRVVRIRVSSAWDELEPEERRHALVHELMHAHVFQLEEAVLEGARQEFGGQAFRMYAEMVRREIERMVDAVATATSPVLPLP